MSDNSLPAQERAEFAAALVYSSLGTAYVYLAGHSIVRYLSPKPQVRRPLRKFLFLSGLIFLLSITRFIFYARGARVNLVEAPGVQHWLDPVGARNDSFYLIVSSIILVCTSNAFWAWRAATVWNDRLKLVPLAAYMSHCVLFIVASILQGKYVNSIISEFSNIFNTTGGALYDQEYGLSLKTSFRRASILKLASSIGFSIISSVMIILHLILAKKNPSHNLFTFALESSLPFTLSGVLALASSPFLDVNRGTFNIALGINSIAMVIWTCGLALGPQLIIFRIFSGRTWSSQQSPRIFEVPPTATDIHDTRPNNGEPFNLTASQLRTGADRTE